MKLNIAFKIKRQIKLLFNTHKWVFILSLFVGYYILNEQCCNDFYDFVFLAIILVITKK